MAIQIASPMNGKTVATNFMANGTADVSKISAVLTKPGTSIQGTVDQQPNGKAGNWIVGFADVPAGPTGTGYTLTVSGGTESASVGITVRHS
jgi:hypothetical protein